MSTRGGVVHFALSHPARCTIRGLERSETARRGCIVEGHDSCIRGGHGSRGGRPARVRHHRRTVCARPLVAASPGERTGAGAEERPAADRHARTSRRSESLVSAPPRAAARETVSPPRPQIIVVTTAMLVFISFWRAAAIVLCDLASTAYYIGGIVEQAIGKAAPWYIFAVMLFSYAVRGVYIESCAMFVRGGVYRVVKEAMGGTLAKISVSALMFDYVLTGPISGVSAGQYIVGLANELL